MTLEEEVGSQFQCNHIYLANFESALIRMSLLPDRRVIRPSPHTGNMDDPADRITRAAQEAARALRSMGWPVVACEDDAGAWQIRDAILSDDELISFAIWAPNPSTESRADPAEAQTPRDPSAPLDAVEALDCIRAVMGVMIEPTADAAALRLIRAILGKAPHAGNG